MRRLRRLRLELLMEILMSLLDHFVSQRKVTRSVHPEILSASRSNRCAGYAALTMQGIEELQSA